MVCGGFMCSGLQPSDFFLCHDLGLRPRLVYVGPLALNDAIERFVRNDATGPLALNDDPLWQSGLWP